MRPGRWTLVVAALLAPPAGSETLYIEAASVLPIEGAAIPGGRIVVRDGEIAEVGKDVEWPAFSRRIDAGKQWITPGFVVPTTRMGIPRDAPPAVVMPGAGGDDGPVRVVIEPSIKGADELAPRSAEMEFLLEQGITAVGLLPSSTLAGIPGQVSVVSTAPGSAPVEAEAAVLIVVATHGGWREAMTGALEKAREKGKASEKKAAAEKKKSTDDKKSGPDVRKPAEKPPAARFRPTAREVDDARETETLPIEGDASPPVDASSADDKEPPKKPAAKKPAKSAGAKEAGAADAKAEARGKDGEREADPLVRMITKKEPAFVQVGTPAGWVAAQDVLPLDGMDVVLIDGIDLYRLAAEMKTAGVRVITPPALIRIPRTRMPLNRAAEYEAAGVSYAFTLPNDSPRGAARLRDAAIEMVRTGCSRDKVLGALTKVPAAMLGVGDEMGTIEKGRRADLLFWSGDPLDPASRLERVMVAGAFVPRMKSAVLDAP